MQKIGFSGLEIAPTKIFPSEPYDRIDEAHTWSKRLYNDYGFIISSMQSIWYGKTGKIFGQERNELLLYTKKAVDFAEAVGCRNIVFGCPKNRIIPSGSSDDVAVAFFRELGDYAHEHGTTIAMEANPVIYDTNYINTTEEAIDLVRRVASEGFKLNLDVGTMIHNNEDVSVLQGKLDLINHVHVSEPYLLTIQPHKIHSELSALLAESNYEKYISIEAKSTQDLEMIEREMLYVKKIF